MFASGTKMHVNSNMVKNMPAMGYLQFSRERKNKNLAYNIKDYITVW